MEEIIGNWLKYKQKEKLQLMQENLIVQTVKMLLNWVQTKSAPA